MNGRDSRVHWVDFARVVAAALVVTLHVAGAVVTRLERGPDVDWWAANIYDSVTRVCVPLFFMLSGYLLLDRIDTIPEFFRKRVTKIVVPWLAWSAVYLLWLDYFRDEHHELAGAAAAIFAGPVYYHLWFLYTLMGLYLFTPILRVYTAHSPRRSQIYFLTVCGAAATLLPVIRRTTGVEFGVPLGPFVGDSGYFLLGNLVARMPCSRRSTALSAALLVVGAAVTAAGTRWLTFPGGAFDARFYGSMTPNVIAMSVAALVLLKAVGTRIQWSESPRAERALSTLSAATFGVYLIHPIFIDLLADGRFGLKLTGMSFSTFFAVPATALVALSMSFAATALLRRTPLLRRIVP